MPSKHLMRSEGEGKRVTKREKGIKMRERLKKQQGLEAGSLKCSCLFLAISTLTTDRRSERAEGGTEEVVPPKDGHVYRKAFQGGVKTPSPSPLLQTHTNPHSYSRDETPFTTLTHTHSEMNSSFGSALSPILVFSVSWA